MKLFKRMLFVILMISVFVVIRLLIQDIKPLFKNLVDEAIANPLDKDFLTEEFEGLTIRYDSSFNSPFGNAIRNNIDDPVSAYLQLFKEDLLDYKEIESQVKVNLKKMYPDDPRVQNI